jgi:peptidoglycan/LPS O-acetylase OafA/YrhL
LGTPSRRIGQLDLLRAVAIFLVLGAHKYAVSLWRNSGWMGVDLFFVLSGFLVSGLLFKEFIERRGIRLDRFLIRRALKIYPAFYFMLAATLAIELYRGAPVRSGRFLAEMLFVQNYLPSIYGHTWSLAVEEHFYILLSIGLVAASRRAPDDRFSLRVVPAAAAFVMVVCLCLRIATALRPADGPFDVRRYLCPTHLRLDSLAFGVLLSYWYHFHHDRFIGIARRRGAILATSALLIAPSVWLGVENLSVVTLGFTGLYLGFGGILAVCLALPRREGADTSALGLAGSLLARIGAYSYGIYLWHMLVVSLGVSLLRRAYGGPLPYLLEFVLYAAISVLLGVVMTRLVELPVLRLRDRLFPSRAGVVAGPIRPGGAPDGRGA